MAGTYPATPLVLPVLAALLTTLLAATLLARLLTALTRLLLLLAWFLAAALLPAALLAALLLLTGTRFVLIRILVRHAHLSSRVCPPAIESTLAPDEGFVGTRITACSQL